MPLIERKKRLARFVRAAKCSRLLYAQHIEQRGKGFFAEICDRDLEGLSPSARPDCIVENHEEAQIAAAPAKKEGASTRKGGGNWSG